MQHMIITATVPLPDGNIARAQLTHELKQYIAKFESDICDAMGGEYELKTETVTRPDPDDWVVKCLTMRLRPPAY